MKKLIKSLILMTILLISGNLAACTIVPINSNAPSVSSSSEVLNSTSSSMTTLKHTVTFMNGTVVFDTQSIENNKTASKPSVNPVKSNFYFDNWYMELNNDGTGKGDAFLFTAKITKDLTLHAAFSEDEFITVFFTDNNGNIFPQKVFINSILQPSISNFAYYNYSDYGTLIIEEDTTDFELPSEYLYRDICDPANLIFNYQSYDRYEYLDIAKDLLYREKVYNDYTYLSIIGYYYVVQHYVYSQIQLTIIEDRLERRNLIEFIENGVTSVYTMLDIEDLRNDVLVDTEFINDYCHDDIVIIGMNYQILKDNYLQLSFSGFTPYEVWYYEYFIVSDGQELNYNIYNVEKFDLEIYYRSINKVNVTIMHDKLISIENIALYNSKIAEGLKSFIYDDVEFLISGHYKEYTIYCKIYVGDTYYQYRIQLINGILVRIDYSIYDNNDYYFYYIDKDGIAYVEEDALLIDNTIPSEQFANYKKLGLDCIAFNCLYVSNDTFI